MNLCKDCKWYKMPPDTFMAICKHPSSEEIDPVEGQKLYKSCQRQRTSGDCGPAGHYFEQAA